MIVENRKFLFGHLTGKTTVFACDGEISATVCRPLRFIPSGLKRLEQAFRGTKPIRVEHKDGWSIAVFQMESFSKMEFHRATFLLLRQQF